MEQSIFFDPAVAGVLEDKFIEARLHTDGTANIDRILELQAKLTQSVATPFYLVVDPDSGETLSKFEGPTQDPERFAAFLERGL